MSWHFSQALEAEYLAENCSGGEQSAQWSEAPTAPDDSCSDKTKGTFHRSPFGMMFAPSTERRGAELLTWFLAASPARTSAPQERAQDLTESAQDFGAKWPESLARYDRASRSWRTAQCSLLGDLEEFSETWPRWGLMLDGACWELPTLARPISENESGFWPTPTAVTATGGAALCKWGGTGARAKLRKMVTEKELNGPLNPEWVSWLMGWPKGWSSSQHLETDRFQQWCAKPGGYLPHNTMYTAPPAEAAPEQEK